MSYKTKLISIILFNICIASTTLAATSNTSQTQTTVQSDFEQNKAASKAASEQIQKENDAKFEQTKRENDAKIEQIRAASQAASEQKRKENNEKFEQSRAADRADFEQKKKDNSAKFEQTKKENHEHYEQFRQSIFRGFFLFFIIGIVVQIFKMLCRHKKENTGDIYKNQLLLLRKEKQEEIKKAGEAGEKETQFHLSYLSNCYVVNNLFVRTGTWSAEIDHIVIGSAGIVIVETKNFGGTIYVRPNGWVQEKHGQKQGINSPIAQNDRHKVVIEKILRDKGYVDIPVYTVIAISNEKAIIEGEDTVPVMKSENLPAWIRNLPEKLSQENINKLADLFNEINYNKKVDTIT